MIVLYGILLVLIIASGIFIPMLIITLFGCLMDYIELKKEESTKELIKKNNYDKIKNRRFGKQVI